MSRVKEWLMADASGSIDLALAEIAQLTAQNGELLDACTQIIAAVDSNDAEELANGYASARAAIAKARGAS